MCMKGKRFFVKNTVKWGGGGQSLLVENFVTSFAPLHGHSFI